MFKLFCVIELFKLFSYEMGYYFGLFDIYGIEISVLELVDGSNCEMVGDLICDILVDFFVLGDILKFKYLYESIFCWFVFIG